MERIMMEGITKSFRAVNFYSAKFWISELRLGILDILLSFVELTAFKRREYFRENFRNNFRENFPTYLF